MRGEIPAKPVRIYSSANREFDSAKLAIIYGREQDVKSADRYFETSFRLKSFKSKDFPEVKEILDRINSLHKAKEEYEL